MLNLYTQGFKEQNLPCAIPPAPRPKEELKGNTVAKVFHGRELIRSLKLPSLQLHDKWLGKSKSGNWTRDARRQLTIGNQDRSTAGVNFLLPKHNKILNKI